MTTPLAPCEITPLWHTPDACDSPFVCESEHRPGTVQTIPARVRDAVELAGRSDNPDERQVAVWLVEGSVGGEGA